METNPNTPAGSTSAPEPHLQTPTASATVPTHGHAGGAIRKAWLYRRVLQSPLVQPFRKVLRPLIRWVFQPHLSMPAENGRVAINIKPASLATIAWWTIFGPLIFLMLLPLLLILVPLALIVALGALIVGGFQNESSGYAT